MAGALRWKSVGGAVALGGVAALTVVAILGIAVVMLGTQCLAVAGGLGRCDAGPDPIATGSIEPEMYLTEEKDNNVSTVVMTTAAAVTPPKPRDEAAELPPADDLIDTTFALVAEVEQSRTSVTAPGAAMPEAPVQASADRPVAPLAKAVKPLELSPPKAAAAEVVAPVPAVMTAALRSAYAADTASDEAAAAAESAAITATFLAATDLVSVGEQPVEVRASPSTSAAVLFVLQPGGDVEVAERRDGWVRFILADGRGGWIDTRNPGKAEDEAPKTDTAQADKPSGEPDDGATSSDKRIVGGAGVNVRSGPSKSSSKLFALTAGQEVDITGNNRGWLQVIDAMGRKGWVYKSYLTSVN